LQNRYASHLRHVQPSGEHLFRRKESCQKRSCSFPLKNPHPNSRQNVGPMRGPLARNTRQLSPKAKQATQYRTWSSGLRLKDENCHLYSPLAFDTLRAGPVGVSAPVPVNCFSPFSVLLFFLAHVSADPLALGLRDCSRQDADNVAFGFAKYVGYALNSLQLSAKGGSGVRRGGCIC
jgi:hypothetical protein